jgi:replication-associated recombination protein RarA
VGGNIMTKFQTKHKFNDDEVKSALQKEIRRGNEDNAMYWALELAMEGKSSFGWLRNRLKIIAYEDIGLANPEGVLQISKAIDDMDYLYNNSSTDEWKIVLSYIILLMCRSTKSRITDHFKTQMEFYWNKISPEKLEMKIPDYALDIHTTKGNEMGRRKGTFKGVDHFIKHGEYIKNENPDIVDKYKDEAHKVWMPKKK